jgi:hypothetical protein
LHESSERTRRKRVLEEPEVAVARLWAEQEDRPEGAVEERLARLRVV